MTAPVTVAAINRWLRASGINAKLHAGRGYYYLSGDDVVGASSTGIYTYRVANLTMAEWQDEINAILRDHAERTGETA